MSVGKTGTDNNGTKISVTGPVITAYATPSGRAGVLVETAMRENRLRMARNGQRPSTTWADPKHPRAVRSLQLIGAQYDRPYLSAIGGCPEYREYRRGTVRATDAATGRSVWNGAVNGKVTDLAFNDGRLFVVTDAGSVVCFGMANRQK